MATHHQKVRPEHIALIDAPIDIEPYDRNRKILYDGLKEIGYNVIYPQGAFYMWIEALERLNFDMDLERQILGLPSLEEIALEKRNAL